MKNIMIGLALSLSFSAYAVCPNTIAVKPGIFQFTGNVYGLKANFYEYIAGPSDEGNQRVTELKNQGYSCGSSSRAWMLCQRVVRNPQLPTELVEDVRARMKSPWFELHVEDLKVEPVLVKETPDLCQWKVQQPSKGTSPIGDYHSQFYLLESYKTADWVTMTPVKEDGYEAPWKRIVSSDNLRHVQVSGQLNAPQGVTYTYEGEFVAR